MISLSRIEKRYGQRAVLAGLDLDLAPGRRLALVGRSGSGKSTVLRILTGLTRPDAGQARLCGEPVVPERLAALRLRVGYVIQEGGLFPHLDAASNVTLRARRLGWGRGRVAARLEELAALARMPADTLGRYPGELSGGQRQRVGVLRALMLDPDVLLLDEPLGALDPITRGELQEELGELFERLGKTVLLVTHDLDEAARLGHEVALLDEGRLLQRGTLAALRETPATPAVAAFIGAWDRRGPGGA